jgi:hypothetical protein
MDCPWVRERLHCRFPPPDGPVLLRKKFHHVRQIAVRSGTPWGEGGKNVKKNLSFDCLFAIFNRKSF